MAYFNVIDYESLNAKQTIYTKSVSAVNVLNDPKRISVDARGNEMDSL
jgi:hypothetical protein